MKIEVFCSILRENGISCGAGVPCSYFKPLVNQMTVDPELDYVAASSEGEAVAIAAGLIAAGRPAFALMQNSGLGNAVNPVTSLLWIYGIPAVLLVSQRGEPGRPDEPQHELMGRITEDLARLIGLRTHLLEPEPARFAATLRAVLEEQVPAAFVCRKGALEGGPPAPAVALRVRSGPLAPAGAGEHTPGLGREEALRELLPLLADEPATATEPAPAVVATTGKLSRELFELDDRDHQRRNRFYMVGSMGCAAGFGLGLARARPGRPVLVFDGDGAVLMKMGTLASIGHLAPAKLHHFVFDNGAYESTGGQPTASPAVDLAAVALACGYRLAETVSSAMELREAAARHLETRGPTLLRVLVRTGSRTDLGRPTLSPRAGWRRFCDFLQEDQR